jgi:mRNA interferase RelE/StbE
VGNHQGEFSLRVGNYRIVYEIQDAPRTPHCTVFVLTVKHRRHAY